MTDSYQAALQQITRILKRSPGSPTVENLLRLSSIYKFETFREPIDNNLSRISIAGQILVIDIDFEERGSGKRDQTGFHLHSVKLTLASNETNSFQDVNSKTGESILKNALVMYPDLHKFDLCLERLAAIDQHSVIEQGNITLDCFQLMSDLGDYLQKTYGAGVVINAFDEFAFEIMDHFKLYLIQDERMSTNFYRLKGDTLVKDDSTLVNDIGFRVEFVGGKSLPILRQLIKDGNLIVEREEKKTLPTINDSFKAKKSNTTIQMFYNFQSDLVTIEAFQGGDIMSVLNTIDKIMQLQKVIEVLETVQEKCTAVDKFAEMDSEAMKLSEFLNKAETDKMETEHSHLAFTVFDDALDVSGSRADLNATLQFSSPQLSLDLAQLLAVLEKDVV